MCVCIQHVLPGRCWQVARSSIDTHGVPVLTNAVLPVFLCLCCCAHIYTLCFVSPPLLLLLLAAPAF